MSVPESIGGLVSLALWLLVTLLIVKVISKTVGVLLRILIAAVAALAIVLSSSRCVRRRFLPRGRALRSGN